MVLALLWLTPAVPGRAWKSHDWEAMEMSSCEPVHLRPKVEGEVSSVQRKKRLEKMQAWSSYQAK